MADIDKIKIGSTTYNISPSWNNITDKPSSFTPASHTHTKSEIGLGNVDNTADANKRVDYANSAGNADTLDGSHASAFATAGHSHTSLKSNTDNRNANTTPNDYNGVLNIAGLKGNDKIGIDTNTYGTYSCLIGVRGWQDSSGGDSHEIALTGNGQILHRSGSTTSWGGWDKIAHTSYIDTYFPRAKYGDHSYYSDVSNSFIGSIVGGPRTSEWEFLYRAEHRNGAGDGPNYIMEMVSNLTSDSSIYWRKKTGESFTSFREIIDSNNIGSQNVNYANSAGAVAWDNISSKPITITQRNNDSPVSGAYAYGTYITMRNTNNWLEIYAPHMGTSSSRVYMQTGWDNDRQGWKAIAWTSDIPTSLPASDVYAWAKSPNKPSYTASEVGAIAKESNGGIKLTGPIVTDQIAIGHSTFSYSSTSDVAIPINTNNLSIDSSMTYTHYGPTAVYTVSIPQTNMTVNSRSWSNVGTVTYSFTGVSPYTTGTLSGGAQGGGSSYPVTFTIPSHSFTLQLSYGSSYTLKVTYNRSSNVQYVQSAAAYQGHTITAKYYAATTNKTGTIAITSGQGTIYHGQTNIGAACGNNYEVVIGASGKTFTYLSSPTSTWTYISDKRDKTDIELINSSLHFINQLQPVTYVENMRENYMNDDGTFNEEAHKVGLFKKHRRRAGFLAQDVYELLKKEYGTDNYASVVDYNKYKKEDESTFDRYSFNGNQLIPFLVKAIQEQQAIIGSLEEKINALEEKMKKEVN